MCCLLHHFRSSYLSLCIFPLLIPAGYNQAKEETLKFLETYKKPVSQQPSECREIYVRTAFTALNTKVTHAHAPSTAGLHFPFTVFNTSHEPRWGIRSSYLVWAPSCT